MVRRRELTDDQRARLEPLLPPQKPKVGRPGGDLRQQVKGRLWMDRTGAPWRDLSERYGPVGTVSSRFYRWRKARVGGAARASRPGRGVGLGDSLCGWLRDPCAPARGRGKKGDPETDQALGRSQGGFSTKLHRRAEGHGKPLTVLWTAGQRHEAPVFEALMAQGAIASGPNG